MNAPPPSEALQLTFLGNVQRLLEEGQFAATYKYALLVSLTDIAVERGRDDGSALRVPLDWIAEKFIEYFWNHTRPYRNAELFQNKNNARNIAVIGMLRRVQSGDPTLALARQSAHWHTLLRTVGQQIRRMPLFKLQTLRSSGKLVFLYEERVIDEGIELLPGVMFCLRRFSGFIRLLAHQGWLAEVRRIPRNAYLVGEKTSLEEFLFGTERVPLGRVREVLEPIQEGKCFYCRERLGGAPHVDHFVPFALYPGNLAHNLVLAHGGCNSDKSDLLADIPHLDHWATRNQRYGDEISGRMAERGIAGDLESAVGVARWAYSRAEQAGALLWVRSHETRPYPRGAPLPM